ncbi:MAG: hypothetical protein AABY18_02260 [Candidatus Thermoplasmatota archaeon]
MARDAFAARVSPVVLITLIAGCVGAPPSPEEGESHFESSSGSTTAALVEPTIDPVLPENPVFKTWSFEDCFSFAISKEYTFIDAVGTAPPGWTFDPLADGRYLTALSILGLRCGKVSLFGLERGPASFILEIHSNSSPPDKCEEGSMDSIGVVATFLTNDVAIAENLTLAGLPVLYSEIRIQTNNDPAPAHLWEWQLGTEWSALNIQALSDSTRDAPIWTDRFVIWNGTTLSLLDASWLDSPPDVDVQFASGKIGPGMLYSGSTTKSYVGTADLNPRTNMTAELHQFGDSLCEQPL